jgi:(p)ppGpp synthase/HD superfamily hydrolase
VAELTNDSRLSKDARHEDMIRRLAHASSEAKLIKLADRYDNLLSVTPTAAEKRHRILSETPRLLVSLKGTCARLESAISEQLDSMRPHRTGN